MATARHPKATIFVQRHLFTGLTSFAELESKIAALPDEQSRRAAFEVFAEAYLATQRKHAAAQVWLHDSVPLDRVSAIMACDTGKTLVTLESFFTNGKL